MRFKTFLLLLFGLAGVGACVWFYERNQETLQVPVDLFGWETSMGVLLLLVFMGGLVCWLPVWLVRDVQTAMERWRRRRELRDEARVQEAFRKGVDAMVHKRRAEAESAFLEVLERRPEHREALVALGEVYRSQGRFDEAADCHRKAVRLDESDIRAHYALAEDLEAAGKTSAAEAVYAKIVSMRPKRSVAAHEKLRGLYIAEGRWDEALEIQGRLEKLPISSDDKKDRIRRARLGIEFEVLRRRIRQGDPKGATGRLKKMVRSEPEFTPAYVALGEAARDRGKDDEVVSWYREGFAKTGSPVFLTLIEEHFLARQDPAGAIAAFRDLAGRRDSDVLARFFLGRLFTRLEMIEDAWEVFSELRAELPDSPTLAYYIARVHEKRGEHEEACELYRQVIQATEGLRMWYQCTGCGEEIVGWQPWCPECRAWDTYRVEWMEPTSPRRLDVGEVRPVWSRGVSPEADDEGSDSSERAAEAV